MFSTLGFDTSNYTTSAAVYRSDSQGMNSGKLLGVPQGALGLRQSEALFQHVRRLPERVDALQQAGMLCDIAAVGASTAPREAEGSYMPCFLAGESQGRVVAHALGVPFFAFSHQQGHVAAGCWSANRMDLLDAPFLSWHLSGGTTELLLVTPEGGIPHMKIIGATEDIAVGQLIDRVGKMLGIPFPSGKGLDALAEQSDCNDCFPVKLRGLHFSLSGVENQAQKRLREGMAPQDLARFTLNTVARIVRKTTQAALNEYPGFAVLCSGGVASNTLLRREMSSAVFAQPQYSTDNAMGIAILAHRMLLTK